MSISSINLLDRNVEDSSLIRVTFRNVIQRSILIVAIAALLHMAIFIYVQDANWVWSFLFTVCSFSAYALTGVQRSFPVFLTALLFELTLVMVYTGTMTVQFGRDYVYHIWIMYLGSAVMVSGRITMRVKWILAVALLIPVLWLDHVDIPGYHKLTPNANSLIRQVNIGMTYLAIAVATQQYASSIARAQQKLIEIATTDPLTRLSNRRYFLDMASKEMAQSRRNGNLPISVVLIDIDHFKSVNDKLGHESGDTVLCHASKLIKETVRETDYVCRWGGEEFLILLPNTHANGALVIASRICERLPNTPVLIRETPLVVTLTLGIAQIHLDEELDGALHRADAALYAGKAAGRNRVVLSELDATSTNTLPPTVSHNS